MADTIALSRVSSPTGRAWPETAFVPWYIWCAVAGVVSALVGGYWDISWHMSIGRDSFWTPAHIAI